MRKLLILFTVLIVNIINAQGISYNEEFQVNSYTGNWQFNPSVVGLKDGGFTVCWFNESYEQDSLSGIYVQVFDKNFKEIGDRSFIKARTLNFQDYYKCVCGLSDGGFVVCWDVPNEDYWIYAQKFDKNGLKIGNQLQVNNYTGNVARTPCVTGLTEGGFVICWESTEPDGFSLGIAAQQFDSNCTKIGNEFRVNTYTENYQEFPNISSLNNGGFVICWQSYNQDGDGYGVFSQIFNENGEKVGNEYQVNTTTDNWQVFPDITCLENGNFVISWLSSDANLFYKDVYAQMFNYKGETVGNEFKVSSNSANYMNSPTLSSLNSGGFIACWANQNNGPIKRGIFAQLFNNNGIKLGSEFRIDDSTNLLKNSPSVTTLNNNYIITCYSSWNLERNLNDIIFCKYYLDEPINHTLRTFNLDFPNIDETITNSDSKFIWQQVSSIHINFPWELTYDLYIDKDENFTNPIIIKGIQDTTYQIDSLTPGNTYFWKVLARNYYGDSLWSSNVNGFYIDQNATDIKQIDQTVPEEFNVEQNYPNPFNPTTTISYQIPEQDRNDNVILKVYDVLGRLVKVLVNETQKAGNYTVEFDGSSLSSGIYYYTVTAGEFSITKKMLLMK
jgi:hypothetical protein